MLNLGFNKCKELSYCSSKLAAKIFFIEVLSFIMDDSLTLELRPEISGLLDSLKIFDFIFNLYLLKIY